MKSNVFYLAPTWNIFKFSASSEIVYGSLKSCNKMPCDIICPLSSHSSKLHCHWILQVKLTQITSHVQIFFFSNFVSTSICAGFCAHSPKKPVRIPVHQPVERTCLIFNMPKMLSRVLFLNEAHVCCRVETEMCWYRKLYLFVSSDIGKNPSFLAGQSHHIKSYGFLA